MRYFALILALASCNVSMHSTRAPEDHLGLAQRVLNSTVKIEMLGGGHGSGFFCYAPDLVCTANHVVDNISQVPATVRKRNGEVCEIESVNYAPGQNDYAVLKVSCNGDYLGGEVTPQPGLAVMVAGSPQSSEWVVSFGHVMSADEGGHAYGWFSYDAAVNPGNSGGPIVDMNGNLVGLVNAIRTRDGMFAGQAFGTQAHKFRALALGR